MSCFLEILRCILCVDDDREEETRNYNPYYGTSYRSYVPNTTTTTTPTYKPSDARTATQNHTPNYSNSWNSTPTKLPETQAVSFVKPNATDSSVGIKSGASVRIPNMSREEPQKVKNSILPPSSESSQRKALNFGTDKSSAQKLPHGFSSFSSEPSPSLTKLLSSSKIQQPSEGCTATQIHTPISSISRNPTPTKPSGTLTVSFVKPKATIDSSVIKPEAWIRTQDMSREATQKPKILSPSTFPTVFSQKAINSVTDKTSARKVSSFSSQPSPCLTMVLASLKTSPSLSTAPPPPASSLSSSSLGTPPSSPKPLLPSTKRILSMAPSNLTNPNSKTNYIWVEKGTSPIYAIPEDFKDLIKKDVVPGILKRPLSPSTYKDYFEALLYAEDFYIEKWDGFEMKKVTLMLHEATIYKRKGKYNNRNVNDEKDDKDDKVFVAFEIDSIPERRPFLLSRDFVSVRPSGQNSERFQGLIYRVVKSNLVLVEFGEDFHDQHRSECKYDVKFSFNRVCLKRAHQAVAAASDPLFKNFLFPDFIPKATLLTTHLQSIDSKLDQSQVSAVREILSDHNPVPCLLVGPISVYGSEPNRYLSRTGLVVCEAVLQMYRTSSSCRILVCAPTNKTCDVITRKLKEKIPESDIFRANAAFREINGVPLDILPSCLYKRECFSCPSLQELRQFKVISSTFMSSFRLHNEGIMVGHFSHIFLVDASSVTEPEAMVPLANLANESTAVTITGAPGNHTSWIHSDIARENGLMVSYFERLRKSKLYNGLDSKPVTLL